MSSQQAALLQSVSRPINPLQQPFQGWGSKPEGPVPVLPSKEKEVSLGWKVHLMRQ